MNVTKVTLSTTSKMRITKIPLIREIKVLFHYPGLAKIYLILNPCEPGYPIFPGHTYLSKSVKLSRVIYKTFIFKPELILV